MPQANSPMRQDFALAEESEQGSSRGGLAAVTDVAPAVYTQPWMMEPAVFPGRQQNRCPEMAACRDPHVEGGMRRAEPAMSVARFVERQFIPRYVMSKRIAGRAHFQGMLKHILSPERIVRAFGPSSKNRTRLTAIPDWPYLDDLPIEDVRTENIEQLIQASLIRGYSSQTATHLRNVIRTIISYAAECGHFTGPNPATLVNVPSIVHKQVRSLTLPQLKQIFELMRYPERQIALFALLTDMNVAEICGLKWKYVNLSNVVHQGFREPLPARTISVRMQIYRGEYRTVVAKRNRSVQIPELLQSSLLHLERRPKHNSPEDFVLISRHGTPVNPDNVAARRLKAIGQALDLSWVSWKVFHRTGIELSDELGEYMNEELRSALTLTT